MKRGTVRFAAIDADAVGDDRFLTPAVISAYRRSAKDDVKLANAGLEDYLRALEREEGA